MQFAVPKWHWMKFGDFIVCNCLDLGGIIVKDLNRTKILFFFAIGMISSGIYLALGIKTSVILIIGIVIALSIVFNMLLKILEYLRNN